MGGGVASGAAPRGWRALPVLAARTLRDSKDDRIIGLGAEVAFFILLSLPPALLAILGSIGFVANWLGPDVIETIRSQILDVAGNFLTESARSSILEETIDPLLQRGSASVLSIGIVLTLWAASRATTRMVEAVVIAYDQVEDMRSGVKRRVLSFGLTIGGMLGIVVIIPILVAGPDLLAFVSEPLGIAGFLATAWKVLYWPVVGLLGIGLLAWFYHVAAPLKTPWRRDLPGAVLAAVLWLLGGLGLRVYAAFTIESSTYGPLAAPIAFMLWLYVTALAVLIGAELNAEIEKVWPSGARPKDEEQAREREAEESRRRAEEAERRRVEMAGEAEEEGPAEPTEDQVPKGL